MSKNKLLKNSSGFLILNIIRLIFALTGTLYISKRLGPHVFGDYSYILSLYLITFTLDDLCNPNVLKSEILDESNNENEVMGSALKLGFIIHILGIIIFSIIGFFLIKNNILYFFYLCLLSTNIIKPLYILNTYYESQYNATRASFFQLTGVVISIIYRSYYALTNPVLKYQIIGFIIQLIAPCILLLLNYKRKIFQWLSNIKIIYKLFKNSLPIFIGSILTSILMRMDVLMLNNNVNSNIIGQYSIMLKLCEPIAIFCTAICTSIFPVLISSYNNSNSNRYEHIILSTNSLLIYSSLFFGFLGIQLITPFTNIVLGNNYALVPEYFKIYYWIIPFLFLSNFQHLIEVTESQSSLYILRTLLAVISNFLLNYITIPKFGAHGAAYSTLVSFFILTIGTNLIFTNNNNNALLQIKSLNPKNLINIKKAWK